jgi:hypothetical protein
MEYFGKNVEIQGPTSPKAEVVRHWVAESNPDCLLERTPVTNPDGSPNRFCDKFRPMPDVVRIVLVKILLQA